MVKTNEKKLTEVDSKPPKKLVRSSTDKIVAGVCGGLGKYFEIDPIILRILFAIITLTAHGGLIIYIVLWIIMPEDTDEGLDSKKIVEKNAKQLEQKFEEAVENVDISRSGKLMRVFFGFAVALFGLYLLFLNFGIKKYLNIFWYVGKLWPVFIIVLGLYILIKQNDEK